MKTLILVRHAKSSWKNASLADIDRPLNKRGKRDAPKMGKRLAEQNVKIDLIITSPAKRTRKTASVFADHLSYKNEIIKESALYDASNMAILQLIRNLDDNSQTVMLVGHNPGLTNVVNRLSRVNIENVPTCGVVILGYDIDSWTKVDEVTPVWFDFDYPKKL